VTPFVCARDNIHLGVRLDRRHDLARSADVPMLGLEIGQRHTRYHAVDGEIPWQIATRWIC
jgi:hypothetical protein